MGKKYSEGKEYKVIAFVLACFANDEQKRIIKAMAEECGKHRCRVVCFSTLTDFYFDDLIDAGEKKIFDAISVERYDAIVLMAESFKKDKEQTAMVRRANAAGVPVIAVDKYMEGCINLAFDYGDTFREIVEHMVEHHGYRTINFMGGMPGNSYSEERLRVFKEVMAKNGIPVDPRRIYHGYFWEEPTRAAMDKMFADGLPLPEAIICANDAMAITVCTYLQERGYRIPDDIAISGFDGMVLEQYVRPRLTTGIYNVGELVRLIFEILDKDSHEAYREKVTPIYNRMQIGRSCGCAGLETTSAASELVRLRSELDQQLKFQGDVNQMVANFGTAERMDEVIRGIPEYMTPTHYKEFWFCVNDTVFEDSDFGPQSYGSGYGEDSSNYTKVLKVLHYRGEGDQPETDYGGQIAFGDLIPDRERQLDDNDFLLVLTMHTRGETVGYAVVRFDVDTFWFAAYSAFLTNFRHLLEMQRSQRKLMQVYMRDLLTGLYNRNGFCQKMEQLLETAEDKEMTIISMDMDGLKAINDTYGHAEGDEALSTFGRIVQNSIGQEIAVRLGGDEFLVAFVGDGIDGRTEEIVNEIKKGIREYNDTSGKSYQIHASIGAYTDRVKDHSLDYFLKKADDLMYARKYLHKQERRDIR